MLAFIIANPYALLSFNEFRSGLSQQASLAAGEDPVKLGSHGNGVAYYLWTLTWGFGWVPALAALGGGALLVVRRRIGMGLMLIPAPIAFIIFMGNQQRFFGRWLMPIFPILALLAAYGTYELVRALARRRIARPPLAAALAVVVLLAQGVVMAVHNDQVLSRPDTRTLLRAWMVSHVPAGAKVVIEPLVPDSWVGDIGRSLSQTPTGERWWRWPTWLTDLDPQGRPLPLGQRRYVVIDQYERNLRPALLGPVRAQRLLLGGDRVPAGRARIRRAERGAQRDRLLHAAGAARPARLPRISVCLRCAPVAVQLRLVDRLLPAPVRAARAPS